MKTPTELAVLEYVRAHELRCPECESPRVILQLPPERRPWSESKRAQEFKAAAILCLDCAKNDSPAHARGVNTSELADGSASTRGAGIPALPAVGKGREDVQRPTNPTGGTSPGAAAVAGYLARMNPASARGMRASLKLLASMLGAESPDAVAWHRLGFKETSRLQADMIASGRNPDYVKRCITALRGVLDASVQLELMTIEAFARATRLARIRGSRIRKKQLLQEKDLDGLLASTRTDRKLMRAMRDRALLALLLGAGLRREEAASVTTSMLEDGGRKMFVRVVGKGDKERIVPLPDWAAWMIVEFIVARGFAGPVLCPVTQRGIALQKPLSSGQGTYVVARRIWRRAGKNPIGCHAFRRAFGTGLLRKGVDLALTAKLMGHSNPATTAKSYDTRGVEDFSQAVDRLVDPEAGR